MSEFRYPSKTFRIGNYRGWLHFRSCFYPHDYAMSLYFYGYNFLGLYTSEAL